MLALEDLRRCEGCGEERVPGLPRCGVCGYSFLDKKAFDPAAFVDGLLDAGIVALLEVRLIRPHAPPVRASLPIPGCTLRVGRGSTLGISDGVLSIPDPAVSRRHGELSFAIGGVTFADMGSSNGSAVAGKAARPGTHVEFPEGAALDIGAWTSLSWRKP